MITIFTILCKEAWKKLRTSTGLEPVTSRYRCDALPTELWSHWCWEQVNFGFICSRERYVSEWCIWNKSYVNCGSSQLWSQFLQLRKEAWKKFRTSTGLEPVTSCVKKPEKNSGLQRGLNPWPRDHSSFDFISAVHIWFISYAWFTYISFTGTYEPKIDLLPTSVAS